MSRLRVAVLHHWFVTHGGGERVAECLAALLPEAEIFTLVHTPQGLPQSLRDRSLHASFLQRIPGANRRHRELMPLYPEAARSLDLRGFDLVISSDSGPIKGARIPEGTPHLCYCHSPMRYLYDGFKDYRDSMAGVQRLLFSWLAPRVRRSDYAAAQKVTRFVANSHYVQRRIQQNYGRESVVIYPPIDLHRARFNTPGIAYLAAGRMVGYKKTEIIVEACTRLHRALRVVGTGPEEAALRAIAGPTVEFLGHLSQEQLWDEYSRCRALLFAADEDLGMVPLEAQSCGRPVIAYGVGGALETVRGEPQPDPTGIFFAQQTADSLIEAMLRYESHENTFTREAARKNAEAFAAPVFLAAMRAAILEMMPQAADSLANVEQALQTIG
ncbi:MAG: glycosyltransferase [Janthinobacterium lividum]